MAHDLRTDLDELLFQGRQRPIFDRLWRRQGAQEIPQIVGERVKASLRGFGLRESLICSDHALKCSGFLFWRVHL